MFVFIKKQICSANQLTGFYIMGTFVVKGLRYISSKERVQFSSPDYVVE